MNVCYEILYSKTRRNSFKFFCNTSFLPPHWRRFDDSVNEKRLFLTNENWRWHLLVELSYLFFEKAKIKGHPLLFWIIHDFNHSKLTKIRAESTKIDHVWRVWRTLSRVFRPITAYFSIFLDLNSSTHQFLRSNIIGHRTVIVELGRSKTFLAAWAHGN